MDGCESKNQILENLFLEIGNIMYTISTKGIISISIENKKDDIVNGYLNTAINLIKDGLLPSIVCLELEYELNRICLKYDIDDISLKALYIIKRLIYPIININYDYVFSFANNYVSAEIKNKLADIEFEIQKKKLIIKGD